MSAAPSRSLRRPDIAFENRWLEGLTRDFGAMGKFRGYLHCIHVTVHVWSCVLGGVFLRIFIGEEW